MQIFAFRGGGRFAISISDPLLKIGRSQNITAHTLVLDQFKALNFFYRQATASSWSGAKSVLGEMQGNFDLKLRFKILRLFEAINAEL